MEWSQFFIRLQYFNGKKRIHSKSSAQQTRMKMETYRQQEQANKGKENNNRYNIKLGIMSHFSILQRWNNSCIQLTNVLLSSHRLKSLVGWWLCKRHHSRKKKPVPTHKPSSSYTHFAIETNRSNVHVFLLNSHSLLNAEIKRLKRNVREKRKKKNEEPTTMGGIFAASVG